MIAKKLLLPASLAAALGSSATSVMAHCPLCTAAVGAAAVSAKYFGLDASIIGLFVGAAGISFGVWMGKIIKKKFVRFQLPLIVALSFILTVLPLKGLINEQLYVPLLWFGASGSAFNKVYFVDKLMLGSVLGALVSMAAYWLHIYVKKSRGKVLVPYQGVIFTVGILLLAAVVMFFALGGLNG